LDIVQSLVKYVPSFEIEGEGKVLRYDLETVQYKVYFKQNNSLTFCTRLKSCESKVFRRIFDPKRDKVT